jgi:PAS domain S-box-containing protein
MLNLDPASREISIADEHEFLDAISDGVMVIDNELCCRFINRALEAMLPDAREQLMGLPVWDVLCAPENGGFAAQLKRAVSERRTSVITWTRHDNTRVQVHTLPGVDALTLWVRVDYLVQFAARAAAESESRYRTVFEQSPDGIVVYDNDCRVVDCNEAFARLLRSSRSRIIGLHIDDLRDQHHRDALRAALSGRVITFDAPYEATTSGVRLWLTGTFAPLRNGSGAVTGAIVLVKDRSDQVAIQHALEESEKQYKRLVEHLPEAVFVQIDERIAYANPAAARLLGASDSTALAGLSLADLAEPSRREEMRQALRAVLEQREMMARVEQRYLCFDGESVIDVEVMAIPFRHEGRPAILTVARDINARKRVEARLVQAQHLEGVGLLASSVAHDFNNLLLVILANAGMLLEEPTNMQLVEDGANEIEAAARRGSALTRQLMDWKKGAVALKASEIDLNSIVIREEPILRRLLHRKIHLSMSLSAEVGRIYADPDRIGQALVNLVVNARDAMPGGGSVTIDTYITRVHDAETSDRTGLPPGVYATLAICDTGSGIDDATKAKIFEPFFTTKGSGHGTGLGLTIVRDVVHESGGVIAIESAPGLGTSIVIYWPRAASLPNAA